jgi:hypothetical protein
MKMDKPFDIFWFGESGPVWIKAVPTLESAKACINALPLNDSGGYAVLDQRTGNRITFTPNLIGSNGKELRARKITA